MKQTPVQLDDLDRALLDAEAKRLGTSRAAVIRMLVREHLPTTPREVRR